MQFSAMTHPSTRSELLTFNSISWMWIFYIIRAVKIDFIYFVYLSISAAEEENQFNSWNEDDIRYTVKHRTSQLRTIKCSTNKFPDFCKNLHTIACVIQISDQQIADVLAKERFQDCPGFEVSLHCTFLRLLISTKTRSLIRSLIFCQVQYGWVVQW
jgi:uncharacterized protein YpmS